MLFRSAYERGHEALPRVAHAKSPVSERLHFHAELARHSRKSGYLTERQLARKRDPTGSQAGRSFDSRRIMYVHLRGYVQFDFRQLLCKGRGETEVLHDESIRADAKRIAGEIERPVHFGRKNLYVQRHVHANAAHVGEIARLSERLQREVLRDRKSVV